MIIQVGGCRHTYHRKAIKSRRAVVPLLRGKSLIEFPEQECCQHNTKRSRLSTKAKIARGTERRDGGPLIEKEENDLNLFIPISRFCNFVACSLRTGVGVLVRGVEVWYVLVWEIYSLESLCFVPYFSNELPMILVRDGLRRLLRSHACLMVVGCCVSLTGSMGV